MALGINPWARTPVYIPWSGAAIDINFMRRRYYWGGAEKTEANFTTFNLNGSTFDSVKGLTPSSTVDITLGLSGLGTYVPGSYGIAFWTLGAPAALSSYLQLDDTTDSNRVYMAQVVANSRASGRVDSGGTNQSTQTPASGSDVTGARHGAAHSYATNNVMFTANATASAADTAATMPTPTVLRIGKMVAASTTPNAIISRIVIFTSAQANQTANNSLAVAMRDTA
jgi:hypothetical protein